MTTKTSTRVTFRDNLPFTTQHSTNDRTNHRQEEGSEEEEEKKRRNEDKAKEMEERLFVHRQSMDGFTGQLRGGEVLSRYAIPSLLNSHVQRNHMNGMIF